MGGRPFVVVTVPAEDTVLGSLTFQTAARVELFSRADDAPGGTRYAFTLGAQGLDEQESQGAERLLKETAVVLHGRLHHRDRWWAAGWIPAENLAPRSFRLLGKLAHRPAWVVLQGGLAQVRLPMEGDDLRGQVERELDGQDVPGEVHVAQLDAETYEAGIDALAGVPKPAPLVVA